MSRLQDVAKLAKVSLFSASKVMNGNWAEARISVACATRVQAAAEELGYTANFHAQTLSRGRSNTVGLVLREPRLSDPDFSAALILGIESHLASHRHDLLIIGRRGDADELQRGLSCLRQRRIDALIVPGCLGEMIWNDDFESADGVIVLATGKPGSVHPAVDVDPVPGIDAAIRHLAELGHRRVLWFTPHETSGEASVSERRRAFAAAMARHGIRGVETVLPTPGPGGDSDQLSEAARRHFAGILRGPSEHAAVMCYNDAIAIGACRAAQDRGMHVPRDLSIIGFDDFHGRLTAPRLTTISHELAAIGARAAELALEATHDPKRHRQLRSHVEWIPATLVVRDSTAPPRSSKERP